MRSLLTASPSACHFRPTTFPSTTHSSFHKPCSSLRYPSSRNGARLTIRAGSDELNGPTTVDDEVGQDFLNDQTNDSNSPVSGSSSSSGSAAPSIEKDFKKVVNKTAATFAPRASTASKNPAVPGSTLYSIFEIQAYVCMFLGGVLSFNLVFPSNEPDLWRLMGMWSIWMFTIPSLRARDCSNKEKEALNYLFILVPLLNVIIPFFWKSFAVVWSADTVAFFLMYAWKLEWLQKAE